MLLTFILITISIPSSTHSFSPGLKPLFSANPSFSSSGLTPLISRGLFTDTSEHISFFYFLVFLFVPF